MELKSILTERHFRNWPSWHIVFEWENELSDLLQLPIKKSPSSKNLLIRGLRIIDSRIFKGGLESRINIFRNSQNGYFLYFEMKVKNYSSFSNENKAIPVIVDFWDKSNVESIKKYYSDCPFLLITSLEVLNFLKENQFKNRLIHFPMTLPSVYKLDPHQVFEKKYDILVAGRRNEVLWKYLQQYESENPGIEYVYQVQQDRDLYYKSNKRGIIGKFHSREEYMNLLKSARVAFYSTPGIDGGEKRTGGFNPLTPRFFELLAAGCHVIARYPDNEEAQFYKLNEIAPAISSYNDFEHRINEALNTPAPVFRNAAYLNKHYTSTNLPVIESLLQI